MAPIDRHQAGFTLIEAIMAIVITGIVGGMVAVFIKNPVDAYASAARRAALTDAADTAVRRIGRDIRLALSNSVRNPGDGSDQCIEFIPTKTGGRYRVAQTSTGTGNILDFTAEDDAFDMLWKNDDLPAANRIAVDDVVVVYNDGFSGNAYGGTNAVKVASLAAGTEANTTTIGFVDNTTGTPFHRKRLPAESPSFRFQVIPAAEHVVGYGCTGTAPNLMLTRYGRTLSATRAQPANCGDLINDAGSSARLVDGLSVCSLKYEPPGSGTGAGRHGIVSMTLEISRAGEAVRLYHQVHVDNTP